MSARTNDDTTLPAAKRLFKVADSPRKILKLTESQIEKIIYPVGFYKTKAKNIKKTAKILIEKFNSNVPKTREELMSLPGVGRKTANLVLNRAFDIPAIAVDTHVHRISNLLGWVNTKTPQETEFELIKKVPQKYWSEINRLMVSIGRQYRSEKQLRQYFESKSLI